MQADKNKTIRLLRTARGQIDGIIKMMEEDRYCIDVSNQILASQAILGKVNKLVLNAHIENCVMNCSEQEKVDKLKEIETVLDNLL